MPVADSSYIKYLSPTFITSDYEAEFGKTESDTGSPTPLSERQISASRLAHRILEPLGMKSMRTSPTLKSIIDGGRPVSTSRTGLASATMIWTGRKRVLSRLVHHQIIKEIEDSERVLSEFHFQHGFGKYVLIGIVDKLYLKDGKWRIVDFKYANWSFGFIEKYRFQMRFNLHSQRSLVPR